MTEVLAYVKCAECGRYWLAKEVFVFLQDLGNEDSAIDRVEYLGECPRCKRLAEAKAVIDRAEGEK